MSGADLMHPLAVRPAPHILAGHDDRTAQFADLSRSVRLVVAKRRVLVLVTHAVFLSWAAEIFQQSLFNFAASEVRRGCHGVPPGVRGDAASDNQFCTCSAHLRRDLRAAYGAAGPARHQLSSRGNARSLSQAVISKIWAPNVALISKFGYQRNMPMISAPNRLAALSVAVLAASGLAACTSSSGSSSASSAGKPVYGGTLNIVAAGGPDHVERPRAGVPSRWTATCETD